MRHRPTLLRCWITDSRVQRITVQFASYLFVVNAPVGCPRCSDPDEEICDYREVTASDLRVLAEELGHLGPWLAVMGCLAGGTTQYRCRYPRGKQHRGNRPIAEAMPGQTRHPLSRLETQRGLRISIWEGSFRDRFCAVDLQQRIPDWVRADAGRQQHPDWTARRYWRPSRSHAACLSVPRSQDELPQAALAC